MTKNKEKLQCQNIPTRSANQSNQPADDLPF